MADIRSVIEARLAPAYASLEPGADPVLRPSEHADLQSNGALPLAKRLGRSPRKVADLVVATAKLDDICASVEVSGPGFINIVLADDFLASEIAIVASDPRLGVSKAEHPECIVIDYSAPNVAKEMHVGHLRGTIIGDCLCRALGFLGHQIVRENHIGDWGTPFGMLIEHLVELGESEAVEELSVGDLDGFYRGARASFDADTSFQERSRRRVVLLQAGDEETLRLWDVLVSQSTRYFSEVYSKLGVLLEPGDIVGESFYNPLLVEVVRDLDALGLLVESDGARCVFPDGFVNRDGDPLPLIVQKSDGGFGYAATDLAAIRDRIGRIGAQRMLYVVGSPQAQHLAMCFAVARAAGWLPADREAVHVAFGSVLGTDHKMLKSRAGTSVKLVELLDEAVTRAGAAIDAHDGAGDASDRATIARSLGIGAVKYADLSTDRMRDYVFDWDRMLSFDGNTAPYLQYAHARIRSIFRRVEQDADMSTTPLEGAPVGDGRGASCGDGSGPGSAVVQKVIRPLVTEPAERSLALALLGFDEAVRSISSNYSPSKLTIYLYDLASVFTTFYESCPILKAPSVELRQSRLLLAKLTADVLALGLDLLGIEAPDRM